MIEHVKSGLRKYEIVGKMTEYRGIKYHLGVKNFQFKFYVIFLLDKPSIIFK